MKETLREVISRGRWGQILAGVFPAPHIPHFDARLALPSPQQAPHQSPPLASSSARRTHPGHPLPIPMERSTSWKRGGSGYIPLQNPLPWPQATTIIWGGGGILTAKGGDLGFLGAPMPPLQIPPKPLAPTQEAVFSISPHSTLLINCSNSERKEERAQTLKPWELVNQELKFKTNALSCGAPPSFFFSFCSFVQLRDPFRDKHSFLPAPHSLKWLQVLWGWGEELIIA